MTDFSEFDPADAGAVADRRDEVIAGVADHAAVSRASSPASKAATRVGRRSARTPASEP